MTTEEVWNRYSEEVLKYFQIRVRDADAAKDLRQEVFVRVHRQLAKLKSVSKLSNWLAVIMRNVLVDHWKSKQAHQSLEKLGFHEEEELPSALTEMAERCVQGMVENLPDKYGRLVRLSDLEGMKQQEIARIEKLSLSGAKSRIQRGRLLLRQAIESCCSPVFNGRNEMVEMQCSDNECASSQACD